MEDKTLDISYYREELETAIRKLHEAQEEIEALRSENADLCEQAFKRDHRVVIETRQDIDNIEIFFKK